MIDKTLVQGKLAVEDIVVAAVVAHPMDHCRMFVVEPVVIQHMLQDRRFVATLQHRLLPVVQVVVERQDKPLADWILAQLHYDSQHDVVVAAGKLVLVGQIAVVAATVGNIVAVAAVVAAEHRMDSLDVDQAAAHRIHLVVAVQEQVRRPNC